MKAFARLKSVTDLAGGFFKTGFEIGSGLGTEILFFTFSRTPCALIDSSGVRTSNSVIGQLSDFLILLRSSTSR